MDYEDAKWKKADAPNDNNSLIGTTVDAFLKNVENNTASYYMLPPIALLGEGGVPLLPLFQNKKEIKIEAIEGVEDKVNNPHYNQSIHINNNNGIINPGNTCFMNASLQMLSCTWIADFVLANRAHFANQGDKNKLPVTKLFIKIMNKLKNNVQFEGDDNDMTIATFLRYCGFEKGGIMSQNDANDFVNKLINRIESEIQAGFGCRTAFSLIAPQCMSYFCSKVAPPEQSSGKPKIKNKTISYKYEINFVRPIGMGKSNKQEGKGKDQKPISLVDKITQENTVSENVEVYNTEDGLGSGNLRDRINKIKTTKLGTPNTLIYSINRFEYNKSNAQYTKLHKEFDIRETETLDKVEYALTSFVCHHGQGPHSGHYYTVAKAGDGNWYVFNDIHVNQIQAKELEKYKKEIYLMTYTKTSLLKEKKLSLRKPPVVEAQKNQPQNNHKTTTK